MQNGSANNKLRVTTVGSNCGLHPMGGSTPLGGSIFAKAIKGLREDAREALRLFTLREFLLCILRGAAAQPTQETS